MALFKVFRTQQGDLPPAIRDGFCYYVESENKFYVDAYGSRKVLNDIPDELADLISDNNHRTVTDEQIAAWTEIAGIQPATTTKDGLMSAADKEKLDGIDIPKTGDASVSQVVMGNDSRLSDSRNAADVYSWAKAETKPTYTASEVGAISTTEKGAALGVAQLDNNGKVLSSQLPSYVDDVVEYDTYNEFPVVGTAGIIYIDLSTNKVYRWSGTRYVEISASLALGETESTAFRGDLGKEAYDHATAKGSAFNNGLYKITTNAEGHVTAATLATKQDITDLGIIDVTASEKEQWNEKTTVEESSTNGNIIIDGIETTVYTHPGSGTNPHGTTKQDLGLENVGNFKAVSTEENQGLTNTEQENARANIGAGTSSFSGSYDDLTNKIIVEVATEQDLPLVGAIGMLYFIQEDNQFMLWNGTEYTLPASQITYTFSGGQNKFTVTPSDGVAYDVNINPLVLYEDIPDKPDLGTASEKDVAESGDADVTEVVMGNDSRLTNARNAADVYAWAKAANKPTYTAAEVGAIPAADKGANGGVAELDANGKVPVSQLPSYLDDVVEYNSYSAFPATGESGKLYIDISANIVYRWDGTEYVEITSGQSGAGVVSLTQAQYNALTPAEQNNGTIYMITDGTDGWLASDSIYINTTSGLSATNVQDAIDELASDSGSLPPVTASDNGKILQVTNGEWTDVDQVISVQDMIELRSLSNPEIGKFYYVAQNGIAYLYNGHNFIAINTPINPLPYVSSSDDGKILQVVNGEWTAATIPSANGGAF